MLVPHRNANSAYSLPELKTSYLILLKAQNGIQNEREKLQILIDVKNKLRNELPENNFSGNRENYRVTQKNVVVYILYWLLIIIGLTQQTVGSYLFATTLFSIVPGLSATFLAVISIIYVILDAIIFYAFNASFLKDALNLPQRSSSVGTLLKIYNEQITVTIELNESLSKLSILKMDKNHFRDYVKLVVLMNQDLRTKNEEIQKCQLSSVNKILKYAVITFGLLSNIASYYYLGMAFSAFILPVVGVFLAQIMILITIISGLSFYYAIGVTSIIRLADPHKEELDALKKKLTDFSEKYSNDLSNILFLRDEIDQIMQEKHALFPESKLRFFEKHIERPMNIDHFGRSSKNSYDDDSLKNQFF